MKILKFFVAVFAIFGVSVFAYGYLNENKVIDTLVDYYKRSPSTLINNEYKKDVNIDFIKLTDDFVPKNKDEVKNIYYTIIYSGMDDFTFYCDKEYKNCIDDIINVNDDTSLLSQMNNFVNVYNSFKSIKTTYTSSGKITLHVERVYSSKDIERVKNRVNEIYDEIIDPNKTKEENITCNTALEQFYEDKEYIYYFPCIKSKNVIVIYSNGYQETVKSSLEYGDISCFVLGVDEVRTLQSLTFLDGRLQVQHHFLER